LAVGVVAVAVLATALLAPFREVPDPVVTVVGDRLVVCPVGDPVFGATTVSGVGQNLSWSVLGGEASQPTTSFETTDPAAVVLATGDQSIGVLSTAIQRDWLTGVFCAAPTAAGWWDGVWVNDTQQSALILTNTDATTASVTLTVTSETGPLSLPGLRQIPVGRFETRVIDLNAFFRDAQVTADKPVAIALKVESGRVAGYLRSQGELGQDWRQSSVAPSTSLVVPGVPTVVGEGESSTRFLFLTNRGDSPARVTITGQGTGAAVPLAGDNEVEGGPETGGGLIVRAQTTTVLDLSRALAGETIGVLIESVAYREGDEPQPVTAALVVTGQDMASVGAQPALTGGMVLPARKDASLIVTNPGSETVALVLTTRDADGNLVESSEVQIAPGTLSLPLAAESGSVELVVQGPGLRAVLFVPQVGDVAGSIVAPLGAGGATGVDVTIAYDPTLG
jgi:hypothetical protein